MIARGRQVFRLELPLEHAPTLNVYANMKGWQRGKLRTEVDWAIVRAKGHWASSWPMGCVRKTEHRIVKGKVSKRTKVSGGQRRLVVLTRESSREPDELSVDVLGGKIPIDRLVQACVLRGDSRKWLAREGLWRPAKPKHGRVIVEVFDLSPVAQRESNE